MTSRLFAKSGGFLATITLLLALSVGKGDEAADGNGKSVWLETLDLKRMTAGSGSPQSRKSIEGHPLRLHGVEYLHGIGTHAISRFQIALHGAATRFEATVGVDDEKTGQGSVTFTVEVDGKTVAHTPVLRGGDAPQQLSVDLTGAQMLLLDVGDGGDGITSDHADWAGAQIILAQNASAMPQATKPPADARTLPRMTIPPAVSTPVIHGPQVVGATPGRPFLFLVPATGDAPLNFAAANLPAGLSLDSNSGIISGSLAAAGQTKVTLTVRNAEGTDTRTLTIIGGDHQLAQTPPMGWNSWDTYNRGVSDKNTRASADALISTGLAAHGYQYVCIDDTWEGNRDAEGNIQTNKKFPDMKALTDYIHAKGLKFGIYSSPGPKTCGGFEGSYQHEDQDAQSYAAWGVDYLKYDWCSYGGIAGKKPSLDAMKKPYQVMRASLDKVDRDLVFSFCQYGMGDVWTWGAEVGGNLWRTNGDLQDNWGELRSVFESENGREKYAGPGHWNDPDFLSAGYFNWGSVHPTRLTPNEQITQYSIWCLIAAPLIIGGDVTRLDPFTVGLLTNDEAIDIDQDPLGKAAGRVSKEGGSEVWARPLFDGGHAVGLVNLDADTANVTVRWTDLGLTGSQKVRDIWLHKDLGTINDSYSVDVPPHGCVLLKVGP
jgi:alpha-galactosidase